MGRVGAIFVGAWLVPGTAAAERMVFINTDPLVLNSDNGQDPTLDSYNTTGFTAGPISGWPGLTEAQQTELLYWLKEGSLPFDITYTFERPPNGTYDMLVMGTAADNAALFPGLGCSAAIGLSDCEDGNDENISFLFYGCMSMADQMDMHRVAFRIFSALGFGWGLENLTGTGQIMASYSGNGLEFGDTCTAISGAEGCPGHQGCPPGEQNSTADLLARIGARVDDGPPFVSILEPEDGAVVDSDITITAAVGDLFGGLSVELEIVEAGQTAPVQLPPYTWDVTLPDGQWTLRVNATDADMNLTSAEISVCVNLPECGASGSDSTGADDTAGSSSTGDEFTTDIFEPTSTSGEDPMPATTGPAPTTGAPPPNPTSFGGDEPQTSCQCRAQRSRWDGQRDFGPTALGLGLLLLAFTRRE